MISLVSIKASSKPAFLGRTGGLVDLQAIGFNLSRTVASNNHPSDKYALVFLGG